MDKNKEQKNKETRKNSFHTKNNWINNLSINVKIFSGYFIVLIFLIALIFYSNYRLTLLSNTYASLLNDTAISTLESDLSDHFNKTQEVLALMENGDIEKASSQYVNDVNELNEKVDNYLLDMNDLNSAQSSFVQTSLSETRRMIILLFSIASILTLILAVFLVSNINTPIKILADTSKEIAKGNFSTHEQLNFTNDFGAISHSLHDIENVLFSIQDEITLFIDKFCNEDSLSHELPEDKFKNEYQVLISNINNSYAYLLRDLDTANTIISSYAKGDFSPTISRKPENNTMLTTSINELRENLIAVEEKVNTIRLENLQNDILTSTDKNTWDTILETLTHLSYTSSTPLDDMIAALNEMQKGNFGAKITTPYTGSYNDIKNTINQTMEVFDQYLNTVIKYLLEMENGNFDLEIIESFSGNFAPIKSTLNEIIRNFNDTLSKINMSASGVANESQQISNSNRSLAEGANEQIFLVNELTNTIDSIQSQTVSNSDNAVTANNLAVHARNNAEKGNKEMHNMLEAMDEIDNASNNISQVIKVIDEIAFQTNLLALNAAVEAAHAGQHGKGFSVVAEQVRNLAARSQEAAKETTELIETSVNKVSQGTQIAHETARTLDEIEKQVSDISELISNVATVSKGQAVAIEQLVGDIDKIESITKSNTLVSDEGMLHSKELLLQADELHAIVSSYTLQGGSTQSLNIDLSLLEDTKVTPKKTTFVHKPVAYKPAFISHNETKTEHLKDKIVTQKKPLLYDEVKTKSLQNNNQMPANLSNLFEDKTDNEAYKKTIKRKTTSKPPQKNGFDPSDIHSKELGKY